MTSAQLELLLKLSLAHLEEGGLPKKDKKLIESVAKGPGGPEVSA